LIYLITFACYGHRLHGDADGSVDREHNVPGNRLLEPHAGRVAAEKKLMDQAPYLLDADRRESVLGALVERCSNRNWSLIAAHVRTTHVHVLVDAEGTPERVMNDLKSYASRCLNRSGFDDPSRKRWARHGSTGWLHKKEDISAALQYVVDKQGAPMAVYAASEPRP
jgi:REP element-mobilizing transposase RayT